MKNAAAHANALADTGALTKALETLEVACARGDRDALFELAVWKLTGKAGARDLAAAKALLGRAATAGHADAGLMAIAMTANGSGGPSDWAGAVALLRDAAERDAQAAAQAALLDLMKLSPLGTPLRTPALRTLSTDPLIALVQGFLSPHESVYLAHVGNALLAPATVFDPATGRQIEHPIRTSHAGSIGPLREDLVVRAINARIAAISQTNIANGEPLMVLRYTPGQQYRLHSDVIHGAGNQRVRTVLIYLSDGYEGGETEFPDLDLRVRGNVGDALIFDNVDAAGQPHRLAKHAGLPVTAGVKWLATRWIRADPFDAWNPT